MTPELISADNEADRVARIDAVVEDAMQRRRSGEDLPDDRIIAAHQDLMPELAEQLQLLGMIRQARQEFRATAAVALDATHLDLAAGSADAFSASLSGYEILRTLDSGGQGVVYEAIQKATKRHVALKVLPLGQRASAKARHYFQREVELAARLHHPHIVTVYESGAAEGSYYLAMEYVAGRPLDEYVRERKLSCTAIMALFVKVCGAVSYAHQNGIIHRDLKPRNILVDEKGEPHVLDFGLAKRTGDGADRSPESIAVSATGQLVGTLAYMSPEQASGQTERVDVRTDVYSLGVILYQLLTNRFPYEVRGSTVEILRNIQEADPVKPSRLVGSLDSDIQAIAMKALAKEPAERYQSAVELRSDVEYWLQGLPIMAKSASSLYVLRKLISKHRYASGVVGLLVVIILGFGYVSFDFYLQARRAQDQHRRSEEAGAAVRREQGEVATLAVSQKAAALRRGEIAWLLLAWHQGRTAEVRAAEGLFPDDSRERTAVRFLLDPRPLSQKLDEFKTRLGEGERAFAEFFIGEHYMRDGNTRQAVESFRRCVLSGRREWFTTRALARLDALAGTSQPAGSPPVRQEGR